MWPSIIILTIVATVFLTIVITGIRNKKKGKHSCSCGGSCSSCGMGCHGQNNED